MQAFGVPREGQLATPAANMPDRQLRRSLLDAGREMGQGGQGVGDEGEVNIKASCSPERAAYTAQAPRVNDKTGGSAQFGGEARLHVSVYELRRYLRLS